MNPNCTGSMTLLVSVGGESFENHVDFVVVRGGTEFQAINTDPGSVVTTLGKKQLPKD